MTFEEFFLKKKIDLDILQMAKPDLAAEFREHYGLMGSKSFDHTKKYWFNNLRIAYPLTEEKETKLKEAFKPKEAPVSEISKEILEGVASVKPFAGFKPRFKAKEVVQTELNQEILKTEKVDTSSTEIVSKPSGFKPRFKAQADMKQDESKEDEKLEEKPVSPVGFKPRFNSSKTIIANDDDVEDEETKVSKPVGFTPRFKK